MGSEWLLLVFPCSEPSRVQEEPSTFALIALQTSIQQDGRGELIHYYRGSFIALLWARVLRPAAPVKLYPPWSLSKNL